MTPEIRFTSEEYHCPVTNRMETIKIKHSIVRAQSVQADTIGQIIATNTRKTLEICTGIEKCGVKKTYSSGIISNARFDWNLCPFMQMLKGN
jgi:hypothetical protein